jgi:hypothetical protein
MNLATHLKKINALCATVVLGGTLATTTYAQQTSSPQQTQPAQAQTAQTPQRARQQPPAGSTPKAFTLPRTETFKLPNGIEATLIPYGEIPKVTGCRRRSHGQH